MKRKLKKKVINRDISWLSFNERVLQEASDENVPLLERLKFLGIFSNNLDEFFRVRVATIKRMGSLKEAKEILGESPSKLLKQIHRIVVEQQDKFGDIYHHILAELEKNGIKIINEKELTENQGLFVKKYFHDKVLPALVPIMVDFAPKFPYLKDKSIYLAIKLKNSENPKDYKYSLIEVPSESVGRFLILPSDNKTQLVILLDDVIRFCLGNVFSIFKYDKYEAYTIKLTRDAELDLDQDFSTSIAEKISRSIKLRNTGTPVRFIYDADLPKDMLSFFTKKMKLGKEHSLIPGGRYHNFKDFINFPKLGRADFSYPELVPLPVPVLEQSKSIFATVKKRDVLLFFPYQSYDYIIDLLREASIDPKVTSIKITLYRVAKSSNIINALINAIKNGKQVTVVIELQARFDEKNNLYMANKLQEEGAKVFFGVPGLKVHSKLFLITRREKRQIIQYAHIGTGNFNENTARTYSDISLITSDTRITEEVEKIFDFYKDNFKVGLYKHLLVSPFFMRKKLIKLIQTEISFAKEGKPASIILKLNSLVDIELINLLHDAAEKGVKVKLIIRGICSMVPEHPNIEAISIVDRFLEHSRIFVFENGGQEKMYISSADWMIRNLDHRSEVACPIYDKSLQRQIRSFLNLQISDNSKARIFDKKQLNHFKLADGKARLRSQFDFYEYLKNTVKGN